MIDVLNRPAEQYSNGLQYEGSIAALCSAFLGEKTLALYQCAPPVLPQTLCWCSLASTAGDLLKLAFVADLSRREERMRFLKGVGALSGYLNSSISEAEAFGCARWSMSVNASAFETEPIQDFAIYKITAHGGGRPLMYALLQAAGPEQPADNATNGGGVRHAEPALAVNGHIRVTINLGQVELSVEDLISLREGMTIVCQTPAQLEGTIQVAGVDWAGVLVDSDAQCLRLTVKKLFYSQEVDRKLFTGRADVFE